MCLHIMFTYTHIHLILILTHTNIPTHLQYNKVYHINNKSIYCLYIMVWLCRVMSAGGNGRAVAGAERTPQECPQKANCYFLYGLKTECSVTCRKKMADLCPGKSSQRRWATICEFFICPTGTTAIVRTYKQIPNSAIKTLPKSHWGSRWAETKFRVLIIESC